MKLMNRISTPTLLVVTLLAACIGTSQGQTNEKPQSAPKYPNYPSETPDNLKPATATFDYERREVMIPMRDGVKLHTVILVPRSAKGQACAHPADAHALQRGRTHQRTLTVHIWGQRSGVMTMPPR